MRFYTLILIFVITAGTKSVAFQDDPWIRQVSPVSTVLLNCTFTDTLNGWAAGDSGVIIHTSNGGNNWIIQNSTIEYYINDIFFINKRLGWGIANEFLLDGTTILKTTDGGNLWTAQNFPDSSKIFRTIYFLDSLNGYIGGFQGTIFKTTNAGASWIQSSNDSTFFSAFPIAKFAFVTPEIGFACGGQIDIAGVIWQTTDSGLNWKAEAQSPEPIYDIYFKDPLKIICVGGDFEYGAQIIRSSNSGLNWTYRNLGLFGQGQSVDFRTPDEAWMALGFSGTWAITYDGGNNWIEMFTTDTTTLYSVVFPDSLHGWAVGKDGVILKYIPVKTGIQNYYTDSPDTYFLNQNYPNPFNPSTTISYSIPGKEFVSVKIYDVTGKEIVSLVNKLQEAGNHNIYFNGDNLQNGIYFYTLIADGAIIKTRKMIFLK